MAVLTVRPVLARSPPIEPTLTTHLKPFTMHVQPDDGHFRLAVVVLDSLECARPRGAATIGAGAGRGGGSGGFAEPSLKIIISGGVSSGVSCVHAGSANRANVRILGDGVRMRAQGASGAAFWTWPRGVLASTASWPLPRLLFVSRGESAKSHAPANPLRLRQSNGLLTYFWVSWTCSSAGGGEGCCEARREASAASNDMGCCCHDPSRAAGWRVGDVSQLC